MAASSHADAQSAPPSEQDEAVGASISYVFATDLGSGVYDLDGRTLQIYQLTYRKELREATQEKFGIEFELPGTFGFFDFKPVDVLSEGIPTRVDGFSAVPGMTLDFPLRDDWHLRPYVRAGFSVASSHVDGWLYGAGVQLEKDSDFHGWGSLARSEFALAGVEYRDAVSNDRFVRLLQGFDLRRGLDWRVRDRRSSSACTAFSAWWWIRPLNPWGRSTDDPSRRNSASPSPRDRVTASGASMRRDWVLDIGSRARFPDGDS